MEIHHEFRAASKELEALQQLNNGTQGNKQGTWGHKYAIEGHKSETPETKRRSGSRTLGNKKRFREITKR